MTKKEFLQGFIVGLLANIIGLFTAGVILGKLSGRSDSIFKVLEVAQSENFMGKLISLGAILNLVCFFYFIRKKTRFSCWWCIGCHYFDRCCNIFN